MAKVKLLNPADDGRRLDRYELIGEIATGGMATVFLARLGGVGGFQRFVAIKRLHPHLADEDEFVQMFLDEARLAARIHHPHVVPILEVGTSERGYYLVMEYVEGDTLARIVARAFSGGDGVPRPVIVRVLLDALAGLHAAHELADDRGQLLGLVHRDVSPQNVLVGVDGSARITDFGVARATARIATTEVGRLKGKLAYMAPEQTRGEDLDRRTDLFAMGIILWEVLAGQRLFKAESEAATLSRILLEPIPSFAEVGSDAPSQLEAVAQKALERDPTRRFQTAAEMADALERAATEAAKASPTDVGIASPREVAAFVQRVMGQEIGAQRESVRAWLAQSDTSAPRVSKSGLVSRADVTVKLPLDAPAKTSPAAVPEDAPPPVEASASGVESHRTLIGQGPQLPTDDSITSPRARVMGVAEGPAPPAAQPEPEDLAVTVGRGDVAFERGPYQSSAPPPVAAYGAGSVFVPRGIQAMPQDDPLSVPGPPIHRSHGRTIALVALVAALLFGGIFWLQVRSGGADRAPQPPEAGEREATSRAEGEAEREPAAAAPDPDEAPPATSDASGAGVEVATDPSSVPTTPPPSPPTPAPPPKKATGAVPPKKGPPPSEPPPPPPPPPPPAGAEPSDDSFANPYR